MVQVHSQVYIFLLMIPGGTLYLASPCCVDVKLWRSMLGALAYRPPVSPIRIIFYYAENRAFMFIIL